MKQCSQIQYAHTDTQEYSFVQVAGITHRHFYWLFITVIARLCRNDFDSNSTSASIGQTLPAFMLNNSTTETETKQMKRLQHLKFKCKDTFELHNDIYHAVELLKKFHKRLNKLQFLFVFFSCIMLEWGLCVSQGSAMSFKVRLAKLYSFTEHFIAILQAKRFKIDNK